MSREIDERIAFEVMGWVRWTGPAGHKCHGLPHEGGHRDIPEYSTDPAAAWSVVERMRSLGWWWNLSSFGGESGGWRFSVTLDHKSDPDGTRCMISQEQSMPMAVCLAALRAKLAEAEKAKPKLPPEAIQALKDFEQEMQDKTIPEIIHEAKRRDCLAAEARQRIMGEVGTEQALHAAWRKRAEEAEAKLAEWEAAGRKLARKCVCDNWANALEVDNDLIASRLVAEAGGKP